MYEAKPAPPTPNIVEIAAALEKTVVTPAATADPPATAAKPAAMPGAASPPVRAKSVAPTAPAFVVEGENKS